MNQPAFAAVCNGVILTKTLSDTVRAAKINWLVSEAGKMVYSFETDNDIERKFDQENARVGNSVAIRPITISVSNGERDAP